MPIQVFSPTPQPTAQSMLGQAMAQGLAKNFPTPEGQQLRSALDSFKASLTPQDTPQDIAFKFAQKTAGIPGAENLQQTLLPMIMRGQIGSQMYGGQGQPMQPGGYAPPSPAGGQPQGPIGQPMSRGAAPQGQMPSQQPQSAGMQQTPFGLAPAHPGQAATNFPDAPASLPNVMSEAQMDAEARRMAMITNDPASYSTWYDQLRIRNDEARKQAADAAKATELETARQASVLDRQRNLENYVKEKFGQDKFKQAKISPDELNRFMQLGQKYSNISKPEDWFQATKRDFDKYITVRSNFQNANIPGMISGMLRGAKHREEALDRLQGLAEPLVQMGDEEFVKTELAELGLSPTEVQGVIKPLSKDLQGSIKSLPRAPYEVDDGWGVATSDPRKMKSTKDLVDYDEAKKKSPKVINQMTDKLADFIEKSLKKDDSILVLRDRVLKEKGYDWRHFADAFKKVRSKLDLSSDQLGEEAELTNAPRQSLIDIFQDMGRFIDYFKGAK